MMTLSLRNSLQLQQDVLCGPGKLAIAKSSAIGVEGKQFSNERYMTAIVGSSAVEVMALDKDGNVTLQHQLKVESDHFINYQVQVAWTCSTTAADDDGCMPMLILVQANQLWRFTFDSLSKMWNRDTDFNVNLDQQQYGSISSLTSVDGCIYTGTSKGLWEIEDEKPPLRLSLLPITVIAVSDEYLAVSDQEGGLTLYQGGLSCWMKNSCSFQDQQRPTSCCTSLLLHQQQFLIVGNSSGSIRIHSLPEMVCLTETAAHIRSITSLMPTGRRGFASAAEDGFVHLWRLATDGTICYANSLQLDDCLITGGVSVSEGAALLLTAYDRSQIYLIEATQTGDETTTDQE